MASDDQPQLRAARALGSKLTMERRPASSGWSSSLGLSGVIQRQVWVLVLFAAGLLNARANPQGMTVASGTVGAVQNGSQLDITASRNAVINWQSFNIAAGESTRFFQPSAVSVVWNRIFDQNPSQIWGNLTANGIVVLMNQNGFYFGPNSSVNVGGFVAAGAAALPPPDMAGGMWSYQGPPPAASIINYGEIKTHGGGSLFMVAEKIENHGILSAPDGTLGLYAGKEVLLSERPDGRGLSASVALPDGTINNLGQITADAGTIALHARVVNQDGLIQANSVRSQNGVIELVAGDAVNLGPNSVLQANGDATGASDGGNITIKSAHSFADDPASLIEVRGGSQGGNGGNMEISATDMTAINSQLDGSAQAGSIAGQLLLDPYDIILTSSGGSSTPSGTVNVGDSPGATLQLNVNRAFKNFSQITLQAQNDISLADRTIWNLNSSTGVSAPGSQITLEAGNDILFGDGSRLQAGVGWSVNLSAGVDFSSPTHAVRPGIGGIYLNAGSQFADGAIQSFDGDITLKAGHEVIVDNGYVRTVGGGNIFITTGDGDVNSGEKLDTYDYSSAGYAISQFGLGGIGTANGGNVTIQAGEDILSLDATIGAFGAALGNVSLTAGRDIKGNFLVRNGTGNVLAGRDVGNGSYGASFGLVAGGWNITADRDLYLDEIYNPNGCLNPNNTTAARVPFQFDYALDAFANLVGGNSVNLLGDHLAHTPDNASRPPIYAPILNITAGAGGVMLGNDVVLYPSAQGRLTITDGGDLRSSPGNYYQLVVSDSGSADYIDFLSGHAATPTHSGETTAAMQLDVQGDLKNVFLGSPGKAVIHVHGNAENLSFQGQNLSANETTTLQIDGDYSSRANRTSVTLHGTTDFSVFNNPYNPALVVDTALAARLSYDPTTGQLTLFGILSALDLDFLLHPTTYVLDPLTGQREVDAQNHPITVPAVFTTDTAAILQLYADSQNVPASPLASTGLQIGGPGQFNVGAHNLDLGISSGIRSVGTLNNPALAGVMTPGGQVLPGANVDVELTGNLDMISSQIASFSGGGITVNSLGQVNVGAQNSFTSDSTPKGIYSAHGGDVTVHAAGDVLVSGSRIASYDGGNVTVISDHGTVDAGTGAKGFFYVTTSQLNPVTGQVGTRNDKFFGSGILAVTRSDGSARVGDITVQAGGDILANSGGILQIAFNQADQSGAKVALNAVGNIIANASGVLGRDVSLNAGGSIQGLVVASGNLDVHAQQSVSVTALAGGTANVSGQSVSGLVAGGGDVSVAGSEISASVISTGGSANSGGASVAGSAFQGVAAPASQKSTEDADKTLASQTASASDDEDQRKKRAGNTPALARRVGRVTVILPKG